MKVSGFTFIRNAVKYDYPVVEAIKSILPLCDECIVLVGNSDDDTLQLIQNINTSKIKIFHSIWDNTVKSGGRVLALETNKALKKIQKDADWCIYIQGDEAIHEKNHSEILSYMEYYKNDPNVDGFLFNYYHFYGSYDFVATSNTWYSHEIRIIKNDPSIYSYRDAQGFRKGHNKKLHVIPINAHIYHYGWVKEPKTMSQRSHGSAKLYHGNNFEKKHFDFVDYDGTVNLLKKFEYSHPMVMDDRINRKNWKFDYDISYNKKPFKDRLKYILKNYLGLDFSYKNYIKLKDNLLHQKIE